MATEPTAFKLGESRLGPHPTAHIRVRFGERWRWARKRTAWFRWIEDTVAGVVTAGALFYLAWRQADSKNLHDFLKSAQWWDFAVPIAVGLVVAVVVVPLSKFAWNLVTGRAGVLVDRLDAVVQDNAALASMLESLTHKQKEAHDLLVELTDRARAIRELNLNCMLNMGPLYGEGHVRTFCDNYFDWFADCEKRLKGVLRHPEYRKFLDKRPVWSPKSLDHRKISETVQDALIDQIGFLDGLLLSEFTPPHGIFFGAEQHEIIARYTK